MLTIKLNENTNSGMLYAIAYCEDPDIYSEDFWGWDTESDVGYELMEFGSLIQDADVFDSLEAAEDRADDVLSSIFEDEVFIVGVDPYTPHNLTGFVKKITRDNTTKMGNKYFTSESITESSTLSKLVKSGYTRKEIQKFFKDETGLDMTPENSEEFKKWSAKFLNSINESKSIKESGISEVEPVVKFKGKSSHTFTPDKKWEVDFDEEGNVLARTRQGKPYYFSGHINDKTNEFGHTDEDAIIQAAREQHKLKFGKLTSRKNESKSIKESTTGDYVEVAYICDGFTNFRVYGGGFKTSDALVAVEDEKGKRLRLIMGDVREFYTWYDAKGNVIHEPGYIDTDTDYKGIKTITLNADAKGQKIVLTFDTFEDVYKHFENLYMNATDENYAEEILYSIMCSASAEEYDYIDDAGYAVIEVDAAGIFD